VAPNNRHTATARMDSASKSVSMQVLRPIRSLLPWINRRHLIIGFFVIGIFFRLNHYLGDRALWLDEANLSLNILNRSIFGLFQPLDEGQLAPVGFLIVEKLLTQFFGDSEYVFRFFPLAAAIAGIFLFYVLASKVSTNNVPVIALSLFTVSTWPIYYAAELKQYSSDITAAVILYLCASFVAQRWNVLSLAVLAVVGAITICFSHPSVFILGSITIYFVAMSCIKREWFKLFQIFIVCGIWLASFVATIASVFGSPVASGLQRVWQGAFAPFPPRSVSDIHWYGEKFFEIFSNPLGFSFTGIAAFMFLLGIIYLFKHNKPWLLLLILPIPITVGASMLQLYPFVGRLLLFLVPGVLIIMAAGIEYLSQLTWNTQRAVPVALLGLLLLHPLVNAVSNAAEHTPYERENIKAILEHVERYKRPQDELYIYYTAAPALKYYWKHYNLGTMTTFYGHSPRTNWDDYLQDMQMLRGHSRVWLIFSHVSRDKANMDEEIFFLFFLNKIGLRQDAIHVKGADGYLYDFKNPNRTS
jgi:hypothetical protein